MLADRLARYGRALCYDDLPSAVVQEVKRRILDSLACAFGAWNAPPCKIARDLARTVPLPGGATLWGTVHRTLPDLATFANGALVRYLDFNDTYLSKEPAHPSDNIAAVLAAGEVAHASGARVIQAVALAYEIHCRLCDAAALRPRGWDHVTYGSLSSALGVAKVMKLSESQTEQAVNLAGVANVALRQTRIGDLSMWKACAFSNAARNGLFAALLAQRGDDGGRADLRRREGLHEAGLRSVHAAAVRRRTIRRSRTGAVQDPRHLHQTFSCRVPRTDRRRSRAGLAADLACRRGGAGDRAAEGR